MIEDVLLTREEWDYAYTLARSRGVKQHKKSYELKHDAAQAQKKAQCLKLLEWGQQECIEHKRIAKLEGIGSYPEATFETYETHFQCHECMAELRKQLEG